MAPNLLNYRGQLPFERSAVYRGRLHEHRVALLRRTGTASDATSPDSSTYLGIGLGVGVAILIAIAIVLIQIVRKRKQHRRALEVIEVQQAVQRARQQEVGEVPRPLSSVRHTSFVPLHAKAGWGALSSNEDVQQPAPVAKRKKGTASLPKRFKQHGIPLKRLKRLTAIMESPRSRAPNSPAPAIPESMETMAGAQGPVTFEPSPKTYTLRMVDDGDVFVSPDSPKAEVLPSFAIRSPWQPEPGFLGPDKAPRSMSVGVLTTTSKGTTFDASTITAPDLRRHTRSLSLGAPPTSPPKGPVPPLPIIAPHGEDENSTQQGATLSRASSSSDLSASSSVLVTSPMLLMHKPSKKAASPSLEEVVAGDGDASLKTVPTKQWNNSPLLSGPRPSSTAEPALPAFDGLKSHLSIHSNIARYSTDSNTRKRSSSDSTVSSSEGADQCLSVPLIATAERATFSRVSSSESMRSVSALRKVTTPRRSARKSVSASGSPYGRKTGILRESSGNSLVMQSRHGSSTTMDSGQSSNGNPFQWDQPLPKPSALKGSPNARKGHRRQNCVRISTLNPQILGPPPSRPTSPSIMCGIEEESSPGDEQPTNSSRLRFVANHRLSRPASASSFAQSLRVQALRASLTPSSPTLSLWTAYQEQQGTLPSQISDSQLTVSSISRSASRQSDISCLSIPSFPSPSKTTVSDVQRNQPIPEFHLSRPSTDVDEEESSSPFALTVSSDTEMPSSSPPPVSKKDRYDPTHPAWPPVSIQPPRSEEYDPASPRWDETEPERSSPFLPFAADVREADDEISPRSGPVSQADEQAETPPCSPKTMPESFQGFFTTQKNHPRASEKLTSNNASAMMSQMTKFVDFPGAPVLSPSPGRLDNIIKQAISLDESQRDRAGTTTAQFEPRRAAPLPPPSPSAPVPMPSPLHIAPKSSFQPVGVTALSATTEASDKSSPRGPRTQPANSVLKNAMALRRMNSEANECVYRPSRESRRYVHLGREASPLLPWIGSPDLSESCGDMNDLFDFDFAAASDTSVGAEEDICEDSTGPSQSPDMSDAEKKLDGVLAGLGALPAKEGKNDYWVHQNAPSWAANSPDVVPWGTPTKQLRSIDALRDDCPTPRSIQMTPKSLYDSEGFLRS